MSQNQDSIFHYADGSPRLMFVDDDKISYDDYVSELRPPIETLQQNNNNNNNEQDDDCE